MVTVGAQDAAVVQWRVTIDLLEETAQLSEEPVEMFMPLQTRIPVHMGHERRREHDVEQMLALEEAVPPALADRDFCKNMKILNF